MFHQLWLLAVSIILYITNRKTTLGEMDAPPIAGHFPISEKFRCDRSMNLIT